MVTDPKNLVALITTPTIAWVFARFTLIARRQQGHIRFQLRRSFNEGRVSASSLAFSIHVLLGFGLLCFAPYLAYLSVPPTDHNAATSYVPSMIERALLIALAVALITVNASVLWLIPHPCGYKQYGCATQRELVSSLTILTIAAVEFIAMAMAALGLLIPALKVFFVGPTVLMYIWCAMVCICELADVPWEEHWWGLATLQLARRGPDRKSKLTQTYINMSDNLTAARSVVRMSFAIPAMLGAMQNAAIVFNWTFRPSGVPPGQEVFFILFSLFSTLIMSAGFFTQAQLIFEISAAEGLGNFNQLILLKIVLGMEVFFTQVLPITLLIIGPNWTGHESTKEFNLYWFFWKGGDDMQFL